MNLLKILKRFNLFSIIIASLLLIMHVYMYLICMSLKTLAVKSYSYDVTPADLSLEQEAFEAGDGVSQLRIKIIIMPNYYF